ncbi:hypothetical protein EHS25_008868 [Saitozyma podzolica]|uniref:Uncharacterized protein n=1 Tax=Saitozyma podzolica TaxID=1890683 RepID=A0A427YMV1_9TREE|nr:hypothetical protein EHS25_008868 [Saitozyma podzolica]
MPSVSSVSSRHGDYGRGVISPKGLNQTEEIHERKQGKKESRKDEEDKANEKPLPIHPERFSVADTFANHASTSTSTGGRVAGLGLGLNIRPSVEVDPERIDLALGSLPWPELPFRDPASPGSPLPPSSAVSAPAGDTRLQMGTGTDTGRGKGGTHRSESANANANANWNGSVGGGGGANARGSTSESKGGSASRGFWARKAKMGGIFATLQGELIGTPGKDKERVQDQVTGRSGSMRDMMGEGMAQHSAQRQREDWKRDDRDDGTGRGQEQGHGLGLGLGVGSGSAFGRSSTTSTSTTTTRPDPRSRGREKDLPIPSLPAYPFLSSDPLPEGLPSAISSDRGGSRSQSRLSSRSSTSISTAGFSAGASASQGLSQSQGHSQSSLGRSFSHTRSFSRGNKPAPSPLSLGFLPQHDGHTQGGNQDQDEDDFHRFPGLRTADGSSTSASSQTSPWSISRDPSELDDRRLSVPYSPTLAHGASLDWQRPYPPEVVPGIPPVGDNFNPYDREDEYRFSGMSFPVERPGSAWSGMADIETVPTSRDVSRGSRISWATSANHDHSRNNDRERDRANPSRNKSTKSIRSAKSLKSTKSIRSKRISTTSTSTSAHRPYGSRRWEIARGEDSEGIALVVRGGGGGGDWGGAGAEEEMELGALVGRAAVLERLLRQGKRVSAQSILLHHAARPFSPFATSRPSSRFSRGPSRLSHAPSTKHRSQAHLQLQVQVHDKPALSALLGFSDQAVSTVGRSHSRAGAKSSASTRTGDTGASSRKSLSTSLRYRLSRKIRRNKSREDTFTEISGDYETDDPCDDAEDEVDRLGLGALDEDDDPSLFPPSSRPISGVPLSARDRPSYEPNYGVTLGLPQHAHLEGTPRSSGIGNGNGRGAGLRGLLHSGILIFGEEDDLPPPTPPKPARLRTRIAEALIPRPPGCVSPVLPGYSTPHHAHSHAHAHAHAHGVGGVAVQGYQEQGVSAHGHVAATAAATLGSPFMYEYNAGIPLPHQGYHRWHHQHEGVAASSGGWGWGWAWPWASGGSRRTRRTRKIAHRSRGGEDGRRGWGVGASASASANAGAGSLEWEEKGLNPEPGITDRDADADAGGVRVRAWTQSPRTRSHLHRDVQREKTETGYGLQVLQRSKGGFSGVIGGQWEDAGARRRWVWGVLVGSGIVGVLVVGLLAGILGRKG